MIAAAKARQGGYQSGMPLIVETPPFRVPQNGSDRIMAVRIHVTAIRGCTPAEVRATFDSVIGSGFAEVPVHEHGGWSWFRTSVWAVSNSDLIIGLQQLDKPGIQFTTSDASCWYATLCRPGAELCSLLHIFGQHNTGRDFEDDDFEDDDPDNDDEELLFLIDDPPPRLGLEPRT